MPTETAAPARHTAFEDAQGLLAGTLLCAFALRMLTSMGLVTGQTAGLGVIGSYLLGLPFGLVFFVVNLPFYWLGYRRMGARFTLKTFACVALLSVFSFVMTPLVSFEVLNPWLGAVMFVTLAQIDSALFVMFHQTDGGF